MKPNLCWLLGHSRGPVADRCEIERVSPDLVLNRRFCACCEKDVRSFSLVRRVESGCIMPRGFGLAWVHFNADRAVFLPMPFNLIASVLRRTWFWIKRGGRNCATTPREAYEDGYRQAVRDANN